MSIKACLLFASLCYLAVNSINLAYALLQDEFSFDSWPGLFPGQLDLTNAGGFLNSLTVLVIYISGFMLLWRAVGKNYSTTHKIVEWFFLAQLFLWSLIGNAVSSAGINEAYGFSSTYRYFIA